MSKVTVVGKTDTGYMEPLMNGGYSERTYEGLVYRCEGCGLKWDKRWYAESCEERGHKTWFEQRYGGIVENGVWKGGKAYRRQALGRDKVGVTG